MLTNHAGAGMAAPSERAAHFVRLWTLKEAYVKAVGRGITAAPGLRGFTVSLQPGGRASLADTLRGSATGSGRSGARTADGEAWAGRTGSSQRPRLDGPDPGSRAPAGRERASDGAGDGRAAVGAASSARFGAAAGASGCAPGVPPDPGAGSGTGCQAALDDQGCGARLRIGFESAKGDARRCTFALLSPSERHVAALCLRRARPEYVGTDSAGDTGGDCQVKLSASWDERSAVCGAPEPRLPLSRDARSGGGAGADPEPRVSRSWDACGAACGSAGAGQAQGGRAGAGADGGCEAAAGKLSLRAWRAVPLVGETEVACAVLATADM